MIIGARSRDNNLDVNPLRAKQFSNFRASGKDRAGGLDYGAGHFSGGNHRSSSRQAE